jgi:GAF domain-containing protein
MSSSKVDRTTLAAGLDVLLFVVGVAVAFPYALTWVLGGATHVVTGAFAMALIVVMSRFPLVLTHRSGDVVIGFETCVLVYLVLTAPPVEAFAIWSIGTALANLSSRKIWRSRIFNTGLTILGGGLLVLVVTVFDPGPSQKAVQLVAVMLGCAVYFFFDLLMTACSLAIEDGCTLSSVLRWRSVPLGLACFVSVETLGYLAALLGLSEPGWTLLLLLVPVGTILVAVRSVSHNRQAQARLSGLLEAAIQAPDWSDVDQIESLLLEKAQRTLRHTTATLRSTPAVAPEIGAPIEVEGRPTRHLVVRHHVSGKQFDTDDRAALEALTAVGVSALNRRRLSDQMTYLARHDVLTGLHNRSVFAERLRDALARRAPRGLVAVLYCDLDGFKEVNDLLGHEAGDRLLVAVAHRVLGCLRPEDTAARLGGDEFGILLDDLTDEA